MQESTSPVFENHLTEEQIEHRKRAFNAWLRSEGDKLGYYLLPPSKQQAIHGMLRKAYYAGSNYEARMAARSALQD